MEVGKNSNSDIFCSQLGRITIHHYSFPLLGPMKVLLICSFIDVQCHDNEDVAMERRNHVATNVVMRWMEEKMVISM